MTPKDFLTAVRDALRLVCWTGTSNKIFGDYVFIVPEVPIQQISQFPAPNCWIIDQGDTNHPEHPGLATQNFTILFFVENVGQNMGEGGVIGRNRVTGESDGAGLKDIEKEVWNALMIATTLGSQKIVINITGRAKKQVVGQNFPLLFSSMSCRAFTWIY